MSAISSTATDPTAPLPVVAYTVLTVKATHYLTPHYLRVTLTGPNVAQYQACRVGVNNKVFIPLPGQPDVQFPVLDPVTRRMHWPDPTRRPAVRTFTHRGLDVAAQEMTLDFALHGDLGPAAHWARHARPGAVLGLGMWLHRDEPLYPPADWYLLAGDATALPVIGAMLDTMPAASRGLVCLEVHGPADEQPLAAPVGWQVRWVHNPHPEGGSLLPAQLRTYALPPASASHRFGFVAAEAGAVKAIRHYLRQELGWNRDEVAAYAYWKIGVAEDQSGPALAADDAAE